MILKDIRTVGELKKAIKLSGATDDMLVSVVMEPAEIWAKHYPGLDSIYIDSFNGSEKRLVLELSQ